MKFSYNAEKEEIEGLQIYEWGSDIPLLPLHGISKSLEISSLRFELGPWLLFVHKQILIVYLFYE